MHVESRQDLLDVYWHYHPIMFDEDVKNELYQIVMSNNIANLMDLRITSYYQLVYFLYTISNDMGIIYHRLADLHVLMNKTKKL